MQKVLDILAKFNFDETSPIQMLKEAYEIAKSKQDVNALIKIANELEQYINLKSKVSTKQVQTINFRSLLAAANKQNQLYQAKTSQNETLYQIEQSCENELNSQSNL